jgi:hypothetical protein
MIEHCVLPETVVVGEGAGRSSTITDSAYIGYGKDGLYFENPGAYQVRAVYQAPDGSRVASNVLTLRVRAPLTEEDAEAAELMMGDEQGQLMYLLGSDSPELRQGNAALRQVAEKQAEHPLAVYARLVQGVNAAREFKQITPQNEIKVRPPSEQESEDLLSAAIGSEAPAPPAIEARAGAADEDTLRGEGTLETARRMLEQRQSEGLPQTAKKYLGAATVTGRVLRRGDDRARDRDRGRDRDRDVETNGSRPGDPRPGDPSSRTPARGGSRR